jgi:hypothetical protein
MAMWVGDHVIDGGNTILSRAPGGAGGVEDVVVVDAATPAVCRRDRAGRGKCGGTQTAGTDRFD